MKNDFIYTKQLNNLLEDEANIKFFCDLVNDSIRYNAKKSMEIIKIVISFCETYSLNEAKAFMFYYLACIYFDKAQFEEALKNCLDAKRIFENTANKVGITLIFNVLAAIYNNFGYNKLAAEISIKAISYAKELNKRDLLYKLLINAADYNICTNHIKNAEEIYSYISLNFDDKDNENVPYRCLKANLKLKQNNIKDAIRLFNEAVDIDCSKGSSVYTVEIKRNLALCYSRIGYCKKAKDLFNEAIILSDENDYIYEKSMCLLEYSKFLFEYDCKEIAVETLNKCINIASKYKIRNIIVSASFIMHSYYSRLMDYEKSLHFLELYTTTKYEQNKFYIDKGIEFNKNEYIYENLMHLLYKKTEVIATIGENIINKTCFYEIAETLDNELNKLLDKDFLVIGMYDYYSGNIETYCIMDGKDKKAYITKIDDENSFAAYCIKKGRNIIINNFQIEYKKYVSKIKIVSLENYKNALSSIYVPLYANNKIVGVLSVQSNEVGAYSTEDLNNLIVIANYVAIAVQNALRFKKIEEMASYDSLTGILTRREILKEGEILTSSYEKTEEIFCILMIDIDNFKHINNTYGHVVGDEVLVMLTQTIKCYIRENDYIGRYGGDEFLLICPKTGSNDIKIMAERIRKVVANINFMVNEKEFIKVTLSIGLYEYNKKGLSFIDGVNLADQVLYNAKNTTKNAVICC